MPYAAPRICKCGRAVPAGSNCPACALDRHEKGKGRPSAAARGYGKTWVKARAEFLAGHPRCTCGAAATVVDHSVSHKGDRTLFWDRSLWRPMCAPCHNRKTASTDGGFGNPVRPQG